MKYVLIVLAILVVLFFAVNWPQRAPASGLTRYAPPPIYATWWAKDVACAGVSPRPIPVVSWWTKDQPMLLQGGDGEAKVGYWFADFNKVAITRAYITDERVVRHEMLHALLGRTDHPAMFATCGLL